MNLLIDVGNTWSKWCFDNGVAHEGRYPSQEDPFVALEGIARQCSVMPKRILISTVKSAVSLERLRDCCEAVFCVAPEFIEATKSFAGVTNGYSEPNKLGVDRWLAMIGAFAHQQRGFILVSMGTAITVDVVDDHGEHRGGYIAPGLELMRSALLAGTDKVKPGDIDLKGNNGLLGRNTQDAIRGAMAASICGLIQQAIGHAGTISGGVITVIGTGGQGSQLKAVYPNAVVINNLVLEGLKIVATCEPRTVK